MTTNNLFRRGKNSNKQAQLKRQALLNCSIHRKTTLQGEEKIQLKAELDEFFRRIEIRVAQILENSVGPEFPYQFAFLILSMIRKSEIEEMPQGNVYQILSNLFTLKL